MAKKTMSIDEKAAGFGEETTSIDKKTTGTDRKKELFLKGSKAFPKRKNP